MNTKYVKVSVDKYVSALDFDTGGWRVVVIAILSALINPEVGSGKKKAKLASSSFQVEECRDFSGLTPNCNHVLQIHCINSSRLTLNI